ncbi:SecY-interacting protein [Vibrio sp.]|nr:SecY-interacting protein [Vibrio sp.]
MSSQTIDALREFSIRYVKAYQEQHGTFPCNDSLLDMESASVVHRYPDYVEWQPVEHNQTYGLMNVEQGMGIELDETIKSFYSLQFSADMDASFEGNALTLLQIWNEDDYAQLQENILGHLVTQKRLKLKPTVFIGTIDAELDVISVCNLTGEVILETLGTDKRRVLSANLANFLAALTPLIPKS